MRIGRRWHSFSLVELVIVLAVVAILVVGAIFAINNSQKTARDEERKVVASEISSMVNDVLRATSTFPSASSVVWTTNSVTVSGTVLQLTGYRRYSATQTTASQTRYFYGRDSLGFVVCVKLESGSWYRTGTGLTPCPNN